MIAIITDVHFRMSVALLRDLSEAGVKVVACETDAHPAPVGFASRRVWRTVTLPAEGAIDALFDLCVQLGRETRERPALLPVGAQTLAALSEQRERFSAVCGLAVATPLALDQLNDKQFVHTLGEALEIPVPREYRVRRQETEEAFFSRVPLPCVVKPSCGEKHGLHAESRYKLADSKDALKAAYYHFLSLTDEPPLVQERLPGEAYGCSVLAQQGKVLASICHHRLREYPVTGGPSSCCEALSYPELEAYARRLMEKTGFTGPAMVEFKCDSDGKPRLLEVNPRIWGTYPLTRVSGTNFGYLWYCLAAGLPLSDYQPPQPVKMTFYPSDLAAALGYARRKQLGKACSALADLLNPKVKNGLHERSDPGPWRAYRRSLFERRRKP